MIQYFQNELINNDGQGTLTVRFVTDEYPAGMDCFYFKVNTGKALSMYMTPGWNDENLVVRSFEINGYVLGSIYCHDIVSFWCYYKQG